MKILADTCILSEARHPQGHPRVREAFEKLSELETYVSVITIGEIARGILKLAPSRRQTEFTDWLAGLERQFAPRILPVDSDVSHVWAKLTTDAEAIGRPMSFADGLIAATAIRHGLAVMTRNVADFAPTGVQVIDPLQP